MLRGEFQHKLMKLNPGKLRIYCGESDKMAGLEYCDDGEGWIKICGVEKSELPEYTIYDNKGHIVLGGWRRPVMLLYRMGLVSKERVQKYFGDGFFDNRHVDEYTDLTDPVQKILKRENLRQDDILEAADIIHKMPGAEAKQEVIDRERFYHKRDPIQYVKDSGKEAIEKAQNSFSSEAPPIMPDAPTVDFTK